MKEIKKEGLRSSFVFNIIYEIIVVLSPLLITPKLSRVFGVEYIGIKGFTYSIMYYFSVFALLGIDMFGQRKIAIEKDNLEKRSDIFCTVFLLRLLMFLVTIILYGLFILCFVKSNFEKLVFACWGIYLLRGMINPVWFLQGIGKYKLLSFFNIVSIISYISLTLVFINQKDQLPFYIIIYTGVPFLIALCYFPIVLKYIRVVKPNFKYFSTILKESIVYFIPTIAVAIYSMIDKTILGLFDSTQISTGLYESTDKLIKVAIAICTASYTIVRTRMSNLYALENKNDYRKSYHNIISFSMMLCWPIMFGLIGIAKDFVPLFFGDDFKDVVRLTYVFSCIIPFLTISGLIQAVYIFPCGLQKQMNIYYIIVVTFNIIMNLILIPIYSALGAIIATIIAELLLAVLLLKKAKEEIDILCIFSSSIKYIISSIVMLLFIVIFSKTSQMSLIYTIIVEIFGGAIVYFGICFILKDYFVISQSKKVLNRIFKR